MFEDHLCSTLTMCMRKLSLIEITFIYNFMATLPIETQLEMKPLFWHLPSCFVQFFNIRLQTAALPSQTAYTLLNIYLNCWHDILLGTLSGIILFNNRLMWLLRQTNNNQGWLWQNENIVFQFFILSPAKEEKCATDTAAYEKHWFCILRNHLWCWLSFHPFCAFLESACRGHYWKNKTRHLDLFYLS